VGRIEQTIGEISAIAGSIAAAVEEQDAETAEIARNVGQTAAAAGDMNRCIGEISVIADLTGQRSAQVREGNATLNIMIAGLKQTAIRVVRASANEVDRRKESRRELARGCRITVAGRETSSGGSPIFRSVERKSPAVRRCLLAHEARWRETALTCGWRSLFARPKLRQLMFRSIQSASLTP
jgi:hypothetical protein